MAGSVKNFTTQEIGLLPGQEQDGELDAYVLDNVQVAGARFDRLLKKMMSGSPMARF